MNSESILSDLSKAIAKLPPKPEKTFIVCYPHTLPKSEIIGWLKSQSPANLDIELLIRLNAITFIPSRYHKRIELLSVPVPAFSSGLSDGTIPVEIKEQT